MRYDSTEKNIFKQGAPASNAVDSRCLNKSYLKVPSGIYKYSKDRHTSILPFILLRWIPQTSEKTVISM